jgi:hypothetical protein
MAAPNPSRADDPKKIAGELVQEHGVDRATKIAIENIADAKEDYDNYRLSIWRQVRGLLRRAA